MQETWGNNIFQSTHPLRGATVPSRLIEHFVGISIHAPLAGCDPGQYHDSPREGNFNPRTPCGVRPQPKQARDPVSTHFNPRTPCGVRPDRQRQGRRLVYFNPRTPCGVRCDHYERQRGCGDISIHAPLAGCDALLSVLQREDGYFNPRTPCGVRQSHVRLSLMLC